MTKLICPVCGLTLLINDQDIKITEEVTCDHKGGYKIIYKKLKVNKDDQED